MGMLTFDVSKYHVAAFSGAHGNQNVSCAISLSLPNAYGLLRFFAHGATIPKNSIATDPVSGKTVYTVNFPDSRYPGVIDLLRNETPITLFFRDDTFFAYLSTDNEPIGEEE
jgi:hypothetical protein